MFIRIESTTGTNHWLRISLILGIMREKNSETASVMLEETSYKITKEELLRILNELNTKELLLNGD